jgi:hypothetical protein
MTHFEIYQIVKRLVPADLREKYDHLSYGEMAEVAELSQWSEGLRWAEAQWEKSALQDEPSNFDGSMQGG